MRTKHPAVIDWFAVNHDEMTQLWQALKSSVENEVKRFNDDQHRQELPRAKFYLISDGFQVCRTRGTMEQHLRERAGKKPQPAKQYLNFRTDESFRGIKITVDDMSAVYYRYGADDKGNRVFCALNHGAEFDPEGLAQKFLKPFLFDRA